MKINNTHLQQLQQDCDEQYEGAMKYIFQNKKEAWLLSPPPEIEALLLIWVKQTLDFICEIAVEDCIKNKELNGATILPFSLDRKGLVG